LKERNPVRKRQEKVSNSQKDKAPLTPPRENNQYTSLNEK
jgi:hypothetical protein